MHVTKGGIFSLTLHLLLLFFLVVEFPHMWQRKIPQESVVAVEILPISQMTNVPTKTNKPKEKPKIKGQTKKLAPSKLETTRVIKSEVLESIPLPSPKPQLKKTQELKEKKSEGEKKLAHLQPVKKPKIDEKRKMQIEEDFDSLLKNLETSYEKTQPQEEFKEVKATQSQKPFNPDQQLTMTEEDAFRSQIAKCWNVPAGARDADKSPVLLRISMQKDGTVTNVKLMDTSSYNSQPFYRAIADSAIRAVYRCSPFRLPREKFDYWKELELNFDLREMIY